MTDYVQTAEAATDAIERAAERLALACKVEMELEDARPIVKAEAVKRIMARDSIAATPAEKIVESDPDYAAHRNRQAMAVVETIRARGAYEAAKRRADVAIDLGLLLSRASDFIEPTVGTIEYDGHAIARALSKHLDQVRESTFGFNATRAAALEAI